MDEDNSSIPETHKLGIRASSPPAPVPHDEPPFSVRSETGSQTTINGLPETDLTNVGNTRPPQHCLPFSGDSIEKIYMTYFVTGDMHSYWHGRKVRLEGGSTHFAQLNLMCNLFSTCPRPIILPAMTPHGEYSLRMTFDLDRSFAFLIGKAQSLDTRILQNDESFYSAISGFTDAEGHVGLKKSSGAGYANFALSNRKFEIMSDFQLGLLLRGYKAGLYPLRRNGKTQWSLGVFGNSAVRLLTNLHLRHKEKLRATAIALEYNGKPWKVGGEIYKVHRQDIRIERIRLEKVAEQRYRLRGERRKEKMKIWKS